MPLLHIVVLALVQGITEFLPISSSGHLILVPGVTGWPDQGLAIDVAAHVGTLLAVLVYFWRDVLAMLAGLGRLTTGRVDEGAKLALNIAVATLPALAIGFAVNRYLGDMLRSVHVVAWTMIGFGIVLYAVDRIGLYKLVQSGDLGQLHDAALTAALSAFAGIAAIAFMMRWLRSGNFTIFVVYRLLLGAALLYLIYFRGY